MDNFIKLIQDNLVPTLFALGVVFSIVAIGMAGIFHSIGGNQNEGKSKIIIKNVIIGLLVMGGIVAFLKLLNVSFLKEFYDKIPESIALNIAKPENQKNEIEKLQTDIFINVDKSKYCLTPYSKKITEPEIVDSVAKCNGKVTDIKACPNDILFGYDPNCTMGPLSYAEIEGVLKDSGVLSGVEDLVNKKVFETQKNALSSVASFLGQTKDYTDFNFIFGLPNDVFTDTKMSATFVPFFRYMQVVAIVALFVIFLFKYFLKTIFAISSYDGENNFFDDLGSFLASAIGVFVSGFLVQVILDFFHKFAMIIGKDLLINNILAILNLFGSQQLWSDFNPVAKISTITPTGYSSITTNVLLIFGLFFIILIIILFIKNITRYFTLLIMTILSPFFTMTLFIKDYDGYGKAFYKKFIYTSVSLVVDVIILNFGFIFVGKELSIKTLVGCFFVISFIIFSDKFLAEIYKLSEMQSLKGSSKDVAISSYNSTKKLVSAIGQISNKFNSKGAAVASTKGSAESI